MRLTIEWFQRIVFNYPSPLAFYQSVRDSNYKTFSTWRSIQHGRKIILFLFSSHQVSKLARSRHSSTVIFVYGQEFCTYIAQTTLTERLKVEKLNECTEWPNVRKTFTLGLLCVGLMTGRKNCSAVRMQFSSLHAFSF